MKSYIIVNKKIYEKYKDEILPLSARLFCEPYFYNIKDFTYPIDLNGLTNYLTYIKEIEIYSTSTFIDFINLILILSFLKKNNYLGIVTVNYVFFKEAGLNKSVFVNTKLTKDDYNDIDLILDNIKNNKALNKENCKLIGYLNYKNFYNMLVDYEKFIFSLSEVIEEYDEDIDLIASYLENKYSNMGLNKNYYIEFLKKYM